MSRQSLSKRKRMAVVANPGSMKAILESSKLDTRLLGHIQRQMMVRTDEERDQTKLHVSEMAKADWCPRQSFYRLAGYPSESSPADDDWSFVLENIFDEGHDIHAKWQARVHSLGLLRGIWACLHCTHRWEAISPASCEACGSTAMVYKEVPIRSDRHHLVGHADGDIAEGRGEDEHLDPLLEVKSIGLGTLRFEAPQLLMNHQHKVEIEGKTKTFTDYEGLWKSIRKPLPSHLRQANLYLALKGRPAMIFIYESKWHQQVKEFVVKHRPSVSEPLLDLALDVEYGLRKDRPPARLGWADPEHKTCEKCPFKGACWNEEDTRGNEEPGAGAGREGRGAPEGAGERRRVVRREATLRHPEGRGPARRVVRRSAHEAVRHADPVD